MDLPPPSAEDEEVRAREEAEEAKREASEAAAEAGGAGGKSRNRLDISLDDVVVDDFDDFVGYDDFEKSDVVVDEFGAYAQFGGGGKGRDSVLREGRHESPLDDLVPEGMGKKGKAMPKARWDRSKKAQPLYESGAKANANTKGKGKFGPSSRQGSTTDRSVSPMTRHMRRTEKRARAAGVLEHRAEWTTVSREDLKSNVGDQNNVTED